jgi:hypothetical protein
MADVVDVVENPAAQHVKGRGAAVEKVNLPHYFERQTRWLIGEGGAPTPLARLAGPLSALLFISSVLYCHAMVDLFDVANLSKHDLLRIVGVPGLTLSLAVLSFAVSLSTAWQPAAPLRSGFRRPASPPARTKIVQGWPKLRDLA